MVEISWCPSYLKIKLLKNSNRGDEITSLAWQKAKQIFLQNPDNQWLIKWRLLNSVDMGLLFWIHINTIHKLQ